MSTTITIRISDETRSALDKLAAESRRSRSFLAAEAVTGYVAKRQWLENKINAAEASGVLTDKEVDALFEELTLAD